MSTRDRVHQLFQDGLRPPAIARELGITRTRVYAILGPTPRPNPTCKRCSQELESSRKGKRICVSCLKKKPSRFLTCYCGIVFPLQESQWVARVARRKAAGSLVTEFFCSTRCWALWRWKHKTTRTLKKEDTNANRTESEGSGSGLWGSSTTPSGGE